ncbi:hypothetical protein EG329_000874 [Mollisiaceae sp. DMI_Dod_QoI]|nr:hypothetical protein EG329_000874 [Helotiales sp. DMI_Dod_QoI]
MVPMLKNMDLIPESTHRHPKTTPLSLFTEKQFHLHYINTILRNDVPQASGLDPRQARLKAKLAAHGEGEDEAKLAEMQNYLDAAEAADRELQPARHEIKRLKSEAKGRTAAEYIPSPTSTSAISHNLPRYPVNIAPDDNRATQSGNLV